MFVLVLALVCATEVTANVQPTITTNINNINNSMAFRITAKLMMKMDLVHSPPKESMLGDNVAATHSNSTVVNTLPLIKIAAETVMVV